MARACMRGCVAGDSPPPPLSSSLLLFFSFSLFTFLILLVCLFVCLLASVIVPLLSVHMANIQNLWAKQIAKAVVQANIRRKQTKQVVIFVKRGAIVVLSQRTANFAPLASSKISGVLLCLSMCSTATHFSFHRFLCACLQFFILYTFLVCHAYSSVHLIECMLQFAGLVPNVCSWSVSS